MADNELVYGCNGVTKGTIVEAIQTMELTTVDEVGGCTNAGRSCGRCKPLIADILVHTLGDKYDAAVRKTGLCGCTALSRDEKEMKVILKEGYKGSVVEISKQEKNHL